ncbi:MAG: cobalt-precorrin-5B (C(1))-methyltransferase CbiD [Deltaproteobacteria bacterium]|nr:cobalt-precorrin-5B (C(1))-methyltransferase CbiD [Deltaproteobacteria bacterium]
MEKKDRKNLRLGFSTGTAATAAALGAIKFLREGIVPDEVEVALPKGGTRKVKLLEAFRNGNQATGVVIKDAGDDPDVTNLARVGAIVTELTSPGLTIQGGPGVGRLTKPGLVLPPGEWAINPVPRSMLRNNLLPYLPQAGPGLLVEVFIEDGENLAKKTLNPRLGIVGGLSVLGTTGLVRPFSNSAYIATIDSAMNIAKAMDLTEIVLTTGGRSEGFARHERPDLPQEAFVQIADFFGGGLRLGVKHGFSTIGLAIFFGKAVKQASGESYTHAHKTDMDLSPLALWMPELPQDVKARVTIAPTALAALEILRERGCLAAVKHVATRVIVSARHFTGPGPALWVRLFDFDGTVLAIEKG